LAAVELLAERCPILVQCVDNNGASVAHFAAYSGSIECLRYLGAFAPALMEARDKHGKSVRDVAAEVSLGGIQSVFCAVCDLSVSRSLR
jgi:hypothetical protein